MGIKDNHVQYLEISTAMKPKRLGDFIVWDMGERRWSNCECVWILGDVKLWESFWDQEKSWWCQLVALPWPPEIPTLFCLLFWIWGIVANSSECLFKLVVQLIFDFLRCPQWDRCESKRFIFWCQGQPSITSLSWVTRRQPWTTITSSFYTF